MLIVGVIVLMVTLALVAVSFSLLNLTDKSQALALPEGSVRAVIALMLLIVFAIVSIFLSHQCVELGKPEDRRQADRDRSRRAAQACHDRLHAAAVRRADRANAQAAAGQQQGGAQAAAQTYTVAHYRDLSSPAGDDIAKQLIVLLGTLVTAVASFYFGSSTVSSARYAAERAQRGTGGPNAKAVDPNTLKPDGTSQPLTITGTNLENVAAVELRSADGEPLRADGGSVKPSATGVVCMVTVPATHANGPVGRCRFQQRKQRFEHSQGCHDQRVT